MHNSQEVDVYLQSPSNAVIENARRIRFAPYSDVVANDTQKVKASLSSLLTRLYLMTIVLVKRGFRC